MSSIFDKKLLLLYFPDNRRSLQSQLLTIAKMTDKKKNITIFLAYLFSSHRFWCSEKLKSSVFVSEIAFRNTKKAMKKQMILIIFVTNTICSLLVFCYSQTLHNYILPYFKPKVKPFLLIILFYNQDSTTKKTASLKKLKRCWPNMGIK